MNEAVARLWRRSADASSVVIFATGASSQQARLERQDARGSTTIGDNLAVGGQRRESVRKVRERHVQRARQVAVRELIRRPVMVVRSGDRDLGVLGLLDTPREAASESSRSCAVSACAGS